MQDMTKNFLNLTVTYDVASVWVDISTFAMILGALLWLLFPLKQTGRIRFDASHPVFGTLGAIGMVLSGFGTASGIVGLIYKLLLTEGDVAVGWIVFSFLVVVPILGGIFLAARDNDNASQGVGAGPASHGLGGA